MISRILTAGLLLMASVFLPAPARAQNYTSCYLSFDRNPSGRNDVGCPSRIFLVVDAAVYNFEIGPAADPNDPNLLDPNLCSAGLLIPPVTDDEVRDLVQQFLETETSLWVRPVGDTGLLIRKTKGPQNIVTCGVSTNDTRLRVRSLQVSLPALFIDVDHVVDLGDDDGMSGLTAVSVDVNGAAIMASVAATDTDQKVALAVVTQLISDGYSVAYGGGTGLAVTQAPTGAVLTGGFTAGGNLSTQAIVPPLCTGLDSTSGLCFDPVVFRGAGITMTTNVCLDGMPASITNIVDLATEQMVTVMPTNSFEGTMDLPVTVERLGFDDCCPVPYTMSCTSGISRIDIRITKNGSVPMLAQSIDFNLVSTRRPSPPTASLCEDVLDNTGFLSCDMDLSGAGLADAIAQALIAGGTPAGITVYSRGDVLSLINNKNISRMDLFACLAVEECAPPLLGTFPAYGINDGTPVNNVCNGVCDDEDQPPGMTGYNFTAISGDDCFSGRVAAGVRAIEDVLFINGSTGGPERVVSVGFGIPITIQLNSASGGPGKGNYGLFIWRNEATNLFQANPRSLPAGIGCTVNPTPFGVGGTPQPFRCISGGLPAVVCGSRPPGPGGGPPSAPFLLPVPPFFQVLEFTMQAVLADSNSTSGSGFSTTNAIVLAVSSS